MDSFKTENYFEESKTNMEKIALLRTTQGVNNEEKNAKANFNLRLVKVIAKKALEKVEIATNGNGSQAGESFSQP